MTALDFAFRLGGFSRLVRLRGVLVVVAASGLLLAGFLASVALGSTALPLDRVLSALAGHGLPTDRLIVTQFRLPRAIQAVEAGICLGLAGMLLQRAARNPLASPEVLGIVDGAGLGVILFLALFSDMNGNLVLGVEWQPVAAGLGAALLVGGVFALARGTGNGSPMRPVLYGVALAALAKAAITVLMITAPIHQASQAMHWLAGSVHTATWDEVAVVGAIAVPLAGIAAALARPLALADLDDDTARGAGLNAPRVWVGAIIVSAALTATAVAFVGGIGFVGLIAPHLVRLLVGRSAGAGLVGSALAGAVMVVAADLAVRVLFAPIEVPAGTLTAIIGAPYLLFLLTRRNPTDG